MEGLKITDLFQFVLEIVGLVAAGYWGWTQHEGLARVVATIGLPLVMAVVWGVFRFPGDRTPKHAVVPIPAILRLLLELIFFGLAAALLYLAQQPNAAILLAVLVVIQYIISGRVVFLLTHK